MNAIQRHIICVFSLLLLVLSARAQVSLLDQYAFTSEDDSILIKDYMDPEYNYLFILYGSWCQNCKQQLDEYLPYYADWLAIYKTKIVVLDDFTFDDIDTGLDALSVYPYEAVATERIRVDLNIFNFPTNFLYTRNQDLIVTQLGFSSATEVDEFIVNFFPKNPHPIFRGEIRHTMLGVCGVSDQANYYIPNITHEINGDHYFKATSSMGEVHYIVRMSRI